jgi:hypothetical protein
MSTFDDDLVAALRRSDDPADRRLADLLGGLTPTVGPQSRRPGANDALTSFLVQADPTVARLTEAPTAPVESSADDLVVALGAPTPRRRSMRSSILMPFNKALRMGLLAKVVLGVTVGLTGAGAVVATGALSANAEDVVVVASDGEDDVVASEVDHDFDGLPHADDVDDDDAVEDADEVDDVDEVDDADEAAAPAAPAATVVQPTDDDSDLPDDDDADDDADDDVDDDDADDDDEVDDDDADDDADEVEDDADETDDDD